MRQDRPTGTVTVLFTDLVQSADLMSRLGETAFGELRRTHFAALRRAISMHGGEEVKNTGDGEMAIFRSVVDAFRCAVAMQQATDRQARSGPVPIEIKVGVSVGEVSFEGNDVFGTPVVEAARLVALARPGKILTTVLTRALASGRAEMEIVDVGVFTLKGLPDPVAACEVRWDPLPAASFPLPAFLTGTGRIFVGRDRELERLRHLWKEAGAGDVQLALLAGEPGVGKTSLAARFAADAHEEGAIVLAGRCDEDLGVPYQPFVEALRHLLDHAPETELSGQLGRYPGELSRLVPELTQRIPGLPEPLESDPETERYRLFDAVAGWLTALSRDRPLILVLDDLQWAAKPTLLLLRHVARSPEGGQFLVIGTYRDTEVGRTHPLSELLADLRRRPGVQRLSLSGLDSLAVAAFLEQAAGHPLEDGDLALAQVIFEETEGNPFFVQEVVRHLVETGVFFRRNGRWVAGLPVDEVGIPEGVRDVVGRRVSRLSQTTNQALSAAAVAGVVFELGVVEHTTGVSGDDLLAALEEAAAARLVVEVPGPVVRYRFAHALVRDTLYEELSAARRVVLHRRVAEAIEVVHAGRLDDHLPALAHHFSRAAAPAAATGKAVEYAAQAGGRALVQLAHDEAVAYYRQALDLLTLADGPRFEQSRLELSISLGEAQRRAGDPAYRATLLDAARMAQDRGDPDALARAALANNRGGVPSVAGDVDPERLAVLEAALEAAGTADAGTRARLLANLAVELVFAPGSRRSQELADEALTTARRLGDQATLGHVLVRRYFVLVPMAPGELRACAAELDTVAAGLKDPALAFWAAIFGALVSLLSGDAVTFGHRLETLARFATELGQPSLRWLVMLLQSSRSRIAGQFDVAEAQAREALEIGKAAGAPDFLQMYAGSLFWIRYDQGRLGDLVGVAQQIVERDEPDPMDQAHVALMLCELDRYDEAALLFDSLAVNDFARIPSNFAWLYALTITAEVCACLEDSERASRLYDKLAPHHALLAGAGGSMVAGPVSHFLGLLAAAMGRHSAAEDHFAVAADVSGRMQAPAWLARTRLEWARTLRSRRQSGDTERSRELLGQAMATARELGLGNVERRAGALLREAP